LLHFKQSVKCRLGKASHFTLERARKTAIDNRNPLDGLPLIPHYGPMANEKATRTTYSLKSLIPTSNLVVHMCSGRNRDVIFP